MKEATESLAAAKEISEDALVLVVLSQKDGSGQEEKEQN